MYATTLLSDPIHQKICILETYCGAGEYNTASTPAHWTLLDHLRVTGRVGICLLLPYTLKSTWLASYALTVHVVSEKVTRSTTTTP